ncbi:hypothetical protein QTH91_19525 [Variovorax dokdonensis]|uniref:Penicillin-binding protein activator LpoB n=1 Tax=Variovorax dokdonensis TaxID=344883 RepID=A0ABT7NFP2_9BURK|nr:hypothetical protein [Variovorax dokdonensis]MDM0046690.1 hypothetical protein [Variovorax dokdonensis]
MSFHLPGIRRLGQASDAAWRSVRAIGCASVLSLGLAGCYYPYYQPVPVGAPVPASFDRSFDAVAGAMQDEGLMLSVRDRASGTVVGRTGQATVTGAVRQQADGSVRVQFDATGARDPDLINRVSRSYDRRMGR